MSLSQDAKKLFDDLDTVTCPECGGGGRVPKNSAVADELRARRLEAGITQREVARRMGVSSGYLAELELAQRTWRTSLVEKYLRALRNGSPTAD